MSTGASIPLENDVATFVDGEAVVLVHDNANMPHRLTDENKS